MKRKHCSVCGRTGHNARTCKSAPSARHHRVRKHDGSMSDMGVKGHIDGIERHLAALKKKV